MAIEMNIPGFGDGGTGQSGGGVGSAQDQHAHVPLFDGTNGGGVDDGNGDGEVANDLDEVFKAFADDEGGDDDSGDDDGGFNPSPEEQQGVVKNLESEIRSAIQQMRIPDNAIPDDFDPNDRTQMSNLLNRHLQSTVSQAMRVVFKPMQVAMSQMAQAMNGEMDSKIKAARDGIAAQSVLESQVPEINNPKYSGMIKQMASNLASKGKKPAEQAQLIRKMLNQMGIQDSSGSNRRSTGNGGNQNGRTMRTGKAALDGFFGNWTPPKL